MLIQKVQKNIEKIERKLPSSNPTRYLLAVSGGIDSMAMIHIFTVLNKNFSVAHCNFQLRGDESDKDQQFIKEFCTNNKIPFFTTSFNTSSYSKINKVSTHEAARKLRYDYFHSLQQEYTFDFIVTAHHSDDNIETFFINIFRKTGLKGLSGIPILRERTIFRPMLTVSRKEIAQYVSEKSIPFREDSSNLKDDYLRNKIRHKLIPLITSWDNRHYTNTLSTISNLSDYQCFIDIKLNNFISLNVRKYCPGILYFCYSNLDNNPEDLFLLKLYLLNCGLHSTQASQLTENLHLLKTGNQFYSDIYSLFYDRETLFIVDNTFMQKELETRIWNIKESRQITFENGDRIWVGNTKKNNGYTIKLDESKIQFPLTIRTWNSGDYFFPEGMESHKKSIKKYFTDEKVPRFLKHKVRILADQNNNIIAILGMRNDERFMRNDYKNSLVINFDPAFYYPFFSSQKNAQE